MRRAIASCFLAGTFALGGGTVWGAEGSSEGLGRWLRNPFAKEPQPASAGRRGGGGVQRSVQSTVPDTALETVVPGPAPQPKAAAGKPPGATRRLPGPRAARVTLGDDDAESEPLTPPLAEMPRRRLIPQVRSEEPARSSAPLATTAAAPSPESVPVSERESPSRQDFEASSAPVGEGVVGTTNESTDPPAEERTPLWSRPHVIQRRPGKGVQEAGQTTPATARRKVAGKGSEARPDFAVDPGVVAEVQLAADRPESNQSSNESPDSHSAEQERGRETMAERTTTISPERASLSQRWKSWWGAKK